MLLILFYFFIILKIITLLLKLNTNLIQMDIVGVYNKMFIIYM